LDLSEFVRSLTSVYQLLPIYPCFDGGDGKLVRPAETGAIPHVDQARAQAALDFHHEISNSVDEHKQDDDYKENRYEIRPVIGTFQPTNQSAKLDGGNVKLLHSRAG